MPSVVGVVDVLRSAICRALRGSGSHMCEGELLLLPLEARAGTRRGSVELPTSRAVTPAVMPAVPQQRWVFRSLQLQNLLSALVSPCGLARC